ncbi:hypothetical protein A2U01_0068614, partial [Trifolium medium]|nr:hypothetical protein [Trifolium medium]
EQSNLFCYRSLGDVLGVARRAELARSRQLSPDTGELSVPISLTLARCR